MKRILLISAGILALVLNAQAGFSNRKNHEAADSGKPVAVNRSL